MKTLTIKSFCFIIFSFFLNVPLQGQSCDNAIPLECGTTISSNNIMSGSRFSGSSFSSCYNGNSSFSGNDVLYRVTIKKVSTTNIQLSNLGADLDLFFFTCSNNSLSCFGSSTRSGNTTESVNITTPADDITIYILVDGFNIAQRSNFTLSISDDGCGDDTPSFSCNDATTLDCNRSYTFDTFNSEDQLNIEDYDGACLSGIDTEANPFNGKDRLFKFTVEETSDVSINMTGLTKDLDLLLYEDCNGNNLGNCIDISGNGDNSSENISISDAQGTFYLVVDGYNAEQESNFQLDIACTAKTIDCQGAIALECDQTYTFNNIDTGNDFNNDDDLYSSCLPSTTVLPLNNNYRANDLFFTFTVESVGDVDIEINNLTASFDAFLYQKCENGSFSQCVGAAFRGAKVPERISIENALGTYYLIVDGARTGQEGQFNISINSTSCGDDGTDACDAAIPLACGATESFTTIGAENNFIYQDYEGSCTERIGASDNPFDAPDQFFRFEVGEQEDVTISMTDLNADLDLFLFKDCVDGVLTQCVARSISFGTANEELFIENALGTYYLVVDGYQANQQSSFTLSSNCPQTAASRLKPTICEIPADFINNAVNVISNLSLDSSDAQLNSIVVDENILADFGPNIPDNVVFDAFIFFQSDEVLFDDDPSDLFGINTRTDLEDFVNPKIYVYRCACENGTCGPQFVERSNIENEDGDNFLLNPAAPGFYYIIVAGEINNVYDMNLIPEGPCGEVVENYDLGSTVTGNLSSEFSSFERADSEFNIFECYEGYLDFEGGDIVYQIRVEETQRTTFTLNYAAASGMFLYDFLCGGDCIASAENVAYNIVGTDTTFTVVSNISKIDSVYLTPGIYHLVIDQAEDMDFGDFILSSKTDTTGLPEYFFTLVEECPEPAGNQRITLSENLQNTILGSNNISEDFELLLYLENNPDRARGIEYPIYIPYDANLDTMLLLREEGIDFICHYIQNQELKIKAHNRVTGEVFDTDIVARTPDDSPSDGLLGVNKPNMVITDLQERNRGTFMVNNSTIIMPRSGGTRYFYVQADPNTSWEVGEGNGNNVGNTIEIDPITIGRTFTGTQAIKIEAEENTSQLLHIFNIDIASEDGFHQSVTVYQRGRTPFSPINVPDPEIASLSNRTKIYPNPASERFTIQLPMEAASIQRLVFYDALGKQIILPYDTRSNYLLEVNTSDLPVGVYFMELLLDKQLVTKKFSITR